MTKLNWNGILVDDCQVNGGVNFNGQTVKDIYWNGAHVYEYNYGAVISSFDASGDICEQIEFTFTIDDPGRPVSDLRVVDSVGNVVLDPVTSGDRITIRKSPPEFYHVEAINSCITTVSNDNAGKSPWPPDAPTSLTASISIANEIEIRWFYPADMGQPVCQIDLYRDGTLLQANVSPPYRDTTGVAGVSYDYFVRAFNNCGSSDSNHDSGSIAPPPLVVTDFAASDGLCDYIECTWTDSTATPTPTYNLFEGNTLIQVNISSGFQWHTKNTGVALHIRVVNSTIPGGVRSNEDTGYSLWAPGAPTAFSASDSTTTTGVDCTWTDPADLGNPVCTYDLYRDGVRIAGPVTSGYKDTTGTAGTTYSYHVRAVNSCGGADSNADDGTKKT